MKIRGLMGLMVLSLVAAACGSRLPHAEHLAVAAGGAGALGPRSEAAPRSGAASVAGSGGDASAPGTEGGGATVRTEGKQAAAGAPGGGAPVAPGRGAVGGAPIRVGMIGNFSGVIGSVSTPSRDAFKAWVGMVNARGGINGHSIELSIADDGNDGSRDLAIAKDFVENRKVIALVNFWPAPGGIEPVAGYAESKGIPIVGGSTFEAYFNKSPAMFPQTAGFENWYYSHAKTLAGMGVKKIAIIYCTELTACEYNKNTFRKYAEPLGIQVVYEGRVSVAQPDFTAECVNAQTAGADAYYPVVDGNSVNRLARSCARQNYKPRYFVQAPADQPDAALEGAVGTIPAFPWFVESGSPAAKEFGDAMQQFAKGVTRNGFTGYGWLSGKLLEKAAAHVSAEPKPQEILEGLWAMKGETLGGLTSALTFMRGKPAPEANCAFFIEVKDRKWTAPKGLEQVGCR
jgi:branched-chain amino acid transport system substrate-binding protein